MKIFVYRVGKECSGRWFPGIGYGRWDGIRNAFRMDLKCRRFEGGFGFGPLMVWKRPDRHH